MESDKVDSVVEEERFIEEEKVEEEKPEEEEEEEEDDSDDSRNYKAIEVEKDGQKVIKYVRSDKFEAPEEEKKQI